MSTENKNISSEDKLLSKKNYLDLFQKVAKKEITPEQAVSSLINEDEEEKDSDEFDSQELEMGIEEEKEHKDIYDALAKYMSEKEVDMPLTEEEFYTMIAKVHLKENPKYYSELKKNMPTPAKDDEKDTTENVISEAEGVDDIELSKLALKHLFHHEENGIKIDRYQPDLDNEIEIGLTRAEEQAKEDGSASPSISYTSDWEMEYNGKKFSFSIYALNDYSLIDQSEKGDHLQPSTNDVGITLDKKGIEDILVDGSSVMNDETLALAQPFTKSR